MQQRLPLLALDGAHLLLCLVGVDVRLFPLIATQRRQGAVVVVDVSPQGHDGGVVDVQRLQRCQRFLRPPQLDEGGGTVDGEQLAIAAVFYVGELVFCLRQQGIGVALVVHRLDGGVHPLRAVPRPRKEGQHHHHAGQNPGDNVDVFADMHVDGKDHRHQRGDDHHGDPAVAVTQAVEFSFHSVPSLG